MVILLKSRGRPEGALTLQRDAAGFPDSLHPGASAGEGEVVVLLRRSAVAVAWGIQDSDVGADLAVPGAPRQSPPGGGQHDREDGGLEGLKLHCRRWRLGCIGCWVCYVPLAYWHRGGQAMCSPEDRGSIASRDIHDGALALRCGMELCTHHHMSTAEALLLDMAKAFAPFAHPYLWKAFCAQGVLALTLRLLRSLYACGSARILAMGRAASAWSIAYESALGRILPLTPLVDLAVMSAFADNVRGLSGQADAERG